MAMLLARNPDEMDRQLHFDRNFSSAWIMRFHESPLT